MNNNKKAILRVLGHGQIIVTFTNTTFTNITHPDMHSNLRNALRNSHGLAFTPSENGTCIFISKVHEYDYELAIFLVVTSLFQYQLPYEVVRQ